MRLRPSLCPGPAGGAIQRFQTSWLEAIGIEKGERKGEEGRGGEKKPPTLISGYGLGTRVFIPIVISWPFVTVDSVICKACCNKVLVKFLMKTMLALLVCCG